MKIFALPSDLMARVYTDLDGIVLKAIPIQGIPAACKAFIHEFHGEPKMLIDFPSWKSAFNGPCP
jgi:hypothetical protein